MKEHFYTLEAHHDTLPMLRIQIVINHDKRNRYTYASMFNNKTVCEARDLETFKKRLMQ